MLPRNQRMELLSKAYVRAVAARAGCFCVEVTPDFETDLMICSVISENDRYTDAGSLLELQLKSTTLANVRMGQGQISYDLAVRNYQHLRKVEPVDPERHLVLYILPEEEADWLVQDAQCLSLHHGCYFLSLRKTERIISRFRRGIVVWVECTHEAHHALATIGGPHEYVRPTLRIYESIKTKREFIIFCHPKGVP